MFDGLTKSKFYSKCKSDIKMIRTRIDIIKKKRNAMQKYLRNDVSDLLKNGLDYNAYGRAEGLLVEQIRTSCYELMDQYCAHISNHVSAMDKQKECPEDCREAVSCLMFAAARFADLPELRELRKIFSEKYGNSLDSYVNKEFVEKLTSGLPSKEMKIQLLQDIAAEIGVEWNSKALENKLYNQPAKDCTEETNGTMEISVRKKDVRGAEYGFKNAGELISPKKKTGYTYYERKEATEIQETKPAEVPPVKDIQVDTIKRTEKQKNESASIKNVPKEEENNEKPALKYRYIPPPYTKAKSDLREEKVEPNEQGDPISKPKPVPRSVRRRNSKPKPNPETADVPQGDEKEKVKEITNKEKAAQGQRILKFFDRGDGGDQRDEEETMMDKLLQYYSRKKGPRERGKTAADAEPAQPGSSKATVFRSKEAPARASSLPVELESPTETPKKHTRRASFQPDMLTDNAHVHPNLPDYDDFVARLAAFRGK